MDKTANLEFEDILFGAEHDDDVDGLSIDSAGCTGGCGDGGCSGGSGTGGTGSGCGCNA